MYRDSNNFSLNQNNKFSFNKSFTINSNLFVSKPFRNPFSQNNNNRLPSTIRLDHLLQDINQCLSFYTANSTFNVVRNARERLSNNGSLLAFSPLVNQERLFSGLGFAHSDFDWLFFGNSYISIFDGFLSGGRPNFKPVALLRLGWSQINDMRFMQFSQYAWFFNLFWSSSIMWHRVLNGVTSTFRLDNMNTPLFTLNRNILQLLPRNILPAITHLVSASNKSSRLFSIKYNYLGKGLQHNLSSKNIKLSVKRLFFGWLSSVWIFWSLFLYDFLIEIFMTFTFELWFHTIHSFHLIFEGYWFSNFYSLYSCFREYSFFNPTINVASSFISSYDFFEITMYRFIVNSFLPYDYLEEVYGAHWDRINILAFTDSITGYFRSWAALRFRSFMRNSFISVYSRLSSVNLFNFVVYPVDVAVSSYLMRYSLLLSNGNRNGFLFSSI